MFGEDIDGAVHPGDLFVGVGEDGTRMVEIVAASPSGEGGGGALKRGSVGARSAGDVESKKFDGLHSYIVTCVMRET